MIYRSGCAKRGVYGKTLLGLPVNENVSGLEDWIGE